MTIQAATRHFQVSEKTIRRWIKQGKLKADLVDGRYVVHLDGQTAQTNDQTSLIDQLRSENEQLRGQLTRRDGQIDALTQQNDHLTQVVAMSQKNAAQLTEQLDTSRQMLEDGLRHRPWWRFWGRGR